MHAISDFRTRESKVDTQTELLPDSKSDEEKYFFGIKIWVKYVDQ